MAAMERAEQSRVVRVLDPGLYVLLAVALLFDLALARAQQVRVPGLVVFLLLSVAQAGVCIALLHAGVGRYLATGPAPGDGWSPQPSR